ncbi:tetratricopeptide repeat protein [Fulvivirga sediminis]|uniref:Tetratricopeptide repeat protein n=1 Tax=Fulvivirga sediminis TaxID=2803949 RepID=A0A937F3K2_9BACT|nr:tetratricopeptide repeat protein [Fulvivirga sediminis]MBL3655701.1 tetratricopeptide repeat protein [Fulvivirga sediminis]
MLSFSGQAQNSLYQKEENALYRKGLELLDKSNYTAAREVFEEYIEQSDNDIKKANAEYYIAFCALNLYNPDGEKLISDFIQENEHNPRASSAYYDLGNFYFSQGSHKKAIEYLSKVKLSDLSLKERDETRFKLGYSHFARQEFDDALRYFNAIKNGDNPYSAASSYYAGFVEYEKGDYNEAVTDLRRAEKNDSYKAVVPGMIAKVYYKQKKYEELIQYSSKVLASSNVSQTDFYLLTADAYFNLEKYDKASEFYDKYTDKLRNPPIDVRYRIGYANYRLGNNEVAITNLKQSASEKDSIGIYSSYYLGILYLKEGNKLYALTAFDNTRKNQINKQLREEGAYQYGKVNYDLERSEEAIHAFEDFIQTYPNSKHYDEVNDLLSASYLNSNNYNLAIDHIEKMNFMNESLKKVYQKATFFKGAELFNQGDYPQAVSYFEKSLRYPLNQEFKAQANLWMAEAYSVGQKYEEAIPYYRAIINDSYGKNSQYGLKARYGLGYAYYNTKKYNEALQQFSAYVNVLENSTDKQYYDDALLRVADCYYVSKRYKDALTYYQRAVRYNKADNDYAHLQAGIVMGLMDNVEGAKEEYDYVIKNYPQSRYYDDAMFEKGQLSFQKGQYKEAVQDFTNLIAKKPSSPLVPYAYMRRASSNYNLQEYDKSIDDYETILEKYVSHSVAKEVLLPLQDVLNMQSRASEFDKYLALYKRANPETKGLENVEYETARNQYFNQGYKRAIELFSEYVKNYPDNANAVEAKYYIAESYYRLNDYETALQVYNKLLSDGEFNQMSRVVDRVAEIEYKSGRYENAVYFYYKLVATANTKKEQYYGWAGLMESYYNMGEYDSTRHYANVILERGNVNISSQNKASLYLGKAAYAKGDIETAKDEFINTLNTAKDGNGAEAQYLLAKIFYETKNYQQSIESLIDLNQNFTAYQVWVGKSFLLLADNYIALKDYFQAKGTLNSIIDNFPLESVKDQAREKLKKVKELDAEEKSKSTEQADSLTIDMKDVDNQ